MTLSKKETTMREISERAGVSVMTVSRALRGAGRVSAATTEKVRAIAEEMGYRPNPLVQTLMAGVRRGRVEQSTSLAWVVNHEPGESYPAAMAVVEAGARARADELGFGMQSVYLRQEASRPDGLRRTLRARGISGVVIAPLLAQGTLELFPWADFPVSTVGRSLQSPNIHYVMPHHYHTMSRILKAVRDRGYKRVGMLESVVMDHRAEESYSMMFEHFLLASGKRPGRAMQYYDGWKIDRYAEWIQSYKPDAIIVPFPTLADRLREAGAEIPGSQGLICQSWRGSHAEVTGVRQPLRELGAAAVDLVVAQIHRNERGVPRLAKAVMLEGEWMEGRTLPVRALRTSA